MSTAHAVCVPMIYHGQKMRGPSLGRCFALEGCDDNRIAHTGKPTNHDSH